MTLMFGLSEGLIRSDAALHSPLFKCLDGFTAMAHLASHFPILSKLALNLPIIISRRLLPGYVQFREVCPVMFATIGNMN